MGIENMRRGKFYGYLLLHPLDGWFYIVRQMGEVFGYETFWGQKIDLIDGEKIDLGSIPPILWWIPGFSRDRFPKSYSLHDHNYYLRMFARWFCDYLLFESLCVEILEQAEKRPRWIRYFYIPYYFCVAILVFIAVRLFGWWTWWMKGRKRAQKISENKC